MGLQPLLWFEGRRGRGGRGRGRRRIRREVEIVEKYTYCAFGTLISQGDNNNPYGFTGERQFNEADGLVFLRARYYDPSTGRFISRDPILLPMIGTHGSFWLLPHLVDSPQMLHPYVYTGNNPVNYIDPTGKIVVGPPAGWLERCVRVAREIGAEVHHRFPHAIRDNHMRHCVAICELARREGIVCAWIIGWANELFLGEFTWEDVHANDAGVRASLRRSVSCVEACKDEDERCE